MKQLVFAVFLLIGTSAWAEWSQIGTSASLGGYTVYVDLATIRKTGSTVRMWALLDFSTAQPGPGVAFLSAKNHYELDCDGERIRRLHTSWYSGRMGGGDTVHISEDAQGWDPVAPGSVNEGLWKIACKE
jgi:hypothetical protein